ncbi:MAG: DNA cytosine methyltransferase, partial [Alphaproteobacteria bacterium]|nr:DNA cytosine methyltransferase [Alphaproteobacteria bacterium]
MAARRTAKPTYYEFFAGGGMARAGLGAGWQCLFANDFDAKKRDAYVANWGSEHFRLEDIHKLTVKDLPGHADLAWASFPCQDLSLAGNGAGLKGARSGAFWGFWNLMSALRDEARAPKILVLENVTGALTSNGGRDFAELCRALKAIGYVFGALTIDAVHFVPQSRPRLFIIAVREDIAIPATLT